ncbi:hypothetical protein BC831DRAFT_445952 [Entophlyctis helioformis]|nr:hypothetical protein BC831DRAFT_445952 [Entophlyctis helioformis]
MPAPAAVSAAVSATASLSQGCVCRATSHGRHLSVSEQPPALPCARQPCARQSNTCVSVCSVCLSVCSVSALCVCAARPQTAARRAFATSLPSAYNKIIIMGNVGRAPEHRDFKTAPPASDEAGGAEADAGSSAQGDGYWSLSVAQNYNRKTSDGVWARDTLWHRVRASKLSSSITTGTKVLVEGELRPWQMGEKSGVFVQASRIVPLSRPNAPESSGDALADESDTSSHAAATGSYQQSASSSSSSYQQKPAQQKQFNNNNAYGQQAYQQRPAGGHGDQRF